MPMIVCERTDCAYNRATTEFNRCSATTIGMSKNGCDTYFVLPETAKSRPLLQKNLRSRLLVTYYCTGKDRGPIWGGKVVRSVDEFIEAMKVHEDETYFIVSVQVLGQEAVEQAKEMYE